MNKVIEAIMDRRSCRSFTNEQIEDTKLTAIMECALCAPSGRDEQGIHFTVIQNKEALSKINTMVGRDCMYGASTLIVVHAHKTYRYAAYDGSAAMENMYIAATSLGYGACWINQLKDFDTHEVLNELGLKDEIIVGSLAVGIKMQESEPREINKNRITYIR